MMTIKDVAERTGRSVYTIRYYAREGLIPNVRRGKHGERRFTEDDLEYVYMIECMKNCGMSIEEIREFTEWTLAGDSTIEKRLALFLEKLKVMEEKLRQAQETFDAVRYKVWFYETAKRAGTVDVHEKMRPEDVPEEMRKIRARMKHVERLTRSGFSPETPAG